MLSIIIYLFNYFNNNKNNKNNKNNNNKINNSNYNDNNNNNNNNNNNSNNELISLLISNFKNQLEDYKCQACFERLKYKQEIYQCVEGHVACVTCWIEIIKSGKRSCMVCKTPVYSLRNSLSRCRFIENSFKKMVVFCPYAYTFNSLIRKLKVPDSTLVIDTGGCNKVITLGQVDDHKKNCEFRFIKCSNHGCGIMTRFNQDHQSVCPYSLVECELCKSKLKKIEYLNHVQNKCPSALVQCSKCSAQVKRSQISNHTQHSCPESLIKCSKCSIQLKQSELSKHNLNSCPNSLIQCNQCPHQIIRSQLAQHIRTVCQNTIISCTFKEYGCNDQMKRIELPSHLEKVNHSSYVGKLMERLNQNIHYTNQWIISKFLDQLKERNGIIQTTVFNINEIQFKLQCGYHGKDNKNIHFFLTITNFGGHSNLLIELNVKLLNSKDYKKQIQFTMNQEYERRSASWGKSFGDGVKFNKDSGYIFDDDSVKLEFTIYIKKSTTQS